MEITKSIIKANAQTLWATLDAIKDMTYHGTTPSLRYINQNPNDGICLQYDVGYKRYGAYQWGDRPANIDRDFADSNPPQDLIDKLYSLLDTLHAMPEVVKLLMAGEYKSWQDYIVFEIVTDSRPTEMYKDGSRTSYELRLNRAGRVSQTKPQTHRYSYLVAHNMD